MPHCAASAECGCNKPSGSPGACGRECLQRASIARLIPPTQNRQSHNAPNASCRGRRATSRVECQRSHDDMGGGGVKGGAWGGTGAGVGGGARSPQRPSSSGAPQDCARPHKAPWGSARGNTRLREATWSFARLLEAPQGCARLRDARGCERLRLATSCERLREATRGCERLRKAAKGCPRLREAARDCARLCEAPLGSATLREAAQGLRWAP